MKIRRSLSVLCAAVLAAGTGLALAPAANAAGTTSLASVLASDGDTFDRNWYDFDIVDQAVAAVLAAKPGSAVGVLADGSVPLTAFIPNDRAFRVLAYDLTHRWYWSEQKVLAAIAGAVGVDAVEQVLLYHVVPGATITAKTALASNGAVLTTAQGGTITVKVWSRWLRIVQLKDQDRTDLDPFLVPGKLDINKGNVQIAHGVSRVLRPIDL